MVKYVLSFILFANTNLRLHAEHPEEVATRQTPSRQTFHADTWVYSDARGSSCKPARVQILQAKSRLQRSGCVACEARSSRQNIANNPKASLIPRWPEYCFSPIEEYGLAEIARTFNFRQVKTFSTVSRPTFGCPHKNLKRPQSRNHLFYGIPKVPEDTSKEACLHASSDSWIFPLRHLRNRHRFSSKSVDV
ncbi:hypothetical protein ACOME3_010517 [Neoechinorhynchus agilis]